MTADEDRLAIAAYREKYGTGPFLAADAVVVSADGLVLLVRRSAPPQKGRLALPGGFVEADETFLQAAVRELDEETGVCVDLPGLEGNASAVPSLLRDAPDRDPRARIVSVAFLFRLDRPAAALTPKAGDDAAEAGWYRPDADLSSAECFADHYDILRGFGLFATRVPAP